MSYVGIVYGPHDSPLYCYPDGKNYEVVNGNWSFTKNSKRIRGKKGLEWRIVIPEMKHYKDYNEACVLIEEAAKHHK